MQVILDSTPTISLKELVQRVIARSPAAVFASNFDCLYRLVRIPSGEYILAMIADACNTGGHVGRHLGGLMKESDLYENLKQLIEGASLHYFETEDQAALFLRTELEKLV